MRSAAGVAPELLLRPETDRQARFLAFGVIVPPGTTPERVRLHPATTLAEGQFLHAMRLQGWTFTGMWADTVGGPHPTFDPKVTDLPRPPTPRAFKPGEPRPRSDGAPHPKDVVTDVPRLDQCDGWRYLLGGWFHRPDHNYLEILQEDPA